MFGRKTLSDKMKNEAVSLGLCAQWTAEWEDNSSKDEMVEKFVNGIDFCIARDWPSVDVIKKKFGGVIHKHGVYADENIALRNPSNTVILCGNCNADITLDGMAACEIYVRHGSVLHLKTNDFARAFVNVLDDATVNVESADDSRTFVYQYGGSIKQCVGNTHIRDRHDFVWK